jgi:hypothetical protein
MSDETLLSALTAVAADLAKVGVSKAGVNEQQHYKFRGIDGVMNALSPALAKHGVIVAPCVLERTCTERPSKGGGTLFSVVVTVCFTIHGGTKGETMDVTTIGEAMDSADKATNKAMSAAYKYAMLLTFCVPTEGALDEADLTTPQPEFTPPTPMPTLPEGYEPWLNQLRDLATRRGTIALREAYRESRPDYREALLAHRVDHEALKALAAARDRQ